ncbi:MAG: hypothetical protein OXE94_08200 [Aestuariivita sp.]|nr:hypothetical protein [Aestuariivita sp.]MCY4202947.1 hypothetical protein [Aestuariivita sp.]MCY4287324.1 hypothetical protein [Aestuariivita sp.]MCY4346003.1 hypothetical protein [Aestuariivita sp.]
MSLVDSRFTIASLSVGGKLLLKSDLEVLSKNKPVFDVILKRCTYENQTPSDHEVEENIASKPVEFTTLVSPVYGGNYESIAG